MPLHQWKDSKNVRETKGISDSMTGNIMMGSAEIATMGQILSVVGLLQGNSLEK